MSDVTGCAVTSSTGEPQSGGRPVSASPHPYTTGSSSVQDRREPADCMEVEFLRTRSQNN